MNAAIATPSPRLGFGPLRALTVLATPLKQACLPFLLPALEAITHRSSSDSREGGYKVHKVQEPLIYSVIS